MRDYSKVAPQFWTGRTGKALKAKGQEAVIVALYLLTCQHANMLGLYYLSKTYIAADTGLGMEGACKGLQGACEAGFCRYDEDSEVVWVVEMAAYQIGERLDAKDNQCKGVQRAYDALVENPFLRPFFTRYGKAFCMSNCRGEDEPLRSPSEAPPKPGTGAGEGTGEGTGTGSGAAAGKPAPSPAVAGAPAVSTPAPAPAKRSRKTEDPALVSAAALVAEGVTPEHAAQHLAVRKAKNLPLTGEAWDDMKREGAEVGLSPAEVVAYSCRRSRASFRASWWRKDQAEDAGAPPPRGGRPPPTTAAEDLAASHAKAAGVRALIEGGAVRPAATLLPETT